MEYAIYPNGYNPILMINQIGYAFGEEDTSYSAYRSQYIIHYVLKGKGYYNGNAVCAGQGFLIYPGDVPEYHADPREPWAYLWFNTGDPKMEGVFPYYHADPKTLIFDYDYLADVQKLAAYLVSHHNTVCNSFDLTECFFHLFKKHPIEEKRNTSAENYLKFFANYVESHIGSAVKIETLASLLGVSHQYLYKICKKHFGVSPKQYISNRKMFHAKKMLRESALSVTEIAGTLGFEDVLAFSRFFSTHEKKSPLAFRKYTG